MPSQTAATRSAFVHTFPPPERGEEGGQRGFRRGWVGEEGGRPVTRHANEQICGVWFGKLETVEHVMLMPPIVFMNLHYLFSSHMFFFKFSFTLAHQFVVFFKLLS